MENSVDGVLESSRDMIVDIKELNKDGVSIFLRKYMYKPDFKALGGVDEYVENLFLMELERLKAALTNIEPHKIRVSSRKGVYSLSLDESSWIEFWYSEKECRFRFRGLMKDLLSSYVKYYWD